MRKVITKKDSGNSHNVDYKANVKENTAPKIMESFIDDDGEIIHILENGNTQSDISYMKMWGIPKGKIKPKSFKGKGIDSRTNWI